MTSKQLNYSNHYCSEINFALDKSEKILKNFWKYLKILKRDNQSSQDLFYTSKNSFQREKAEINYFMGSFTILLTTISLRNQNISIA